MHNMYFGSNPFSKHILRPTGGQEPQREHMHSCRVGGEDGTQITERVVTNGHAPMLMLTMEFVCKFFSKSVVGKRYIYIDQNT